MYRHYPKQCLTSFAKEVNKSRPNKGQRQADKGDPLSRLAFFPFITIAKGVHFWYTYSCKGRGKAQNKEANKMTVKESISILKKEISFYEYQLKRGSTFANYHLLLELTKDELEWLKDSQEIQKNK